MYGRMNPIGDDAEKGICSRKQEKKLEQEYIKSYGDGDTVLRPHFHPELRVVGWMNDETNFSILKKKLPINLSPQWVN